MVWAQVPLYSDWNGVLNVGGAKITDLNTKFTLEITKMLENRKNEDGKTEKVEIGYKELKRTEIQKIEDPSTLSVPDVVDSDDIKVLNAETLVMIILLELVAILILMGSSSDSTHS